MKEFADHDVEVIGVSGDSVANQEAFKKHNNLTYKLLADEKGQVGKAFGVTRERIRQIENNTLKKLESLPEAQGLKDCV